MCILFIYVSKEETKPSQTKSPFPKLKFLLASNRDETYARPTRSARFWDTNPNILAGQDCQEGGTWLGVSKTGKLAVLLNITSKPPAVKLKSRGDLVTGFLGSDPALRGLTYCNNLHQGVERDIRKQYAPFNFVTVDLLSFPKPTQQKDQSEASTSRGLKSSFDVTYITNGTENAPKVLTEGESEIFAFGNSDFGSPLCKVANGRRDFEEIMKKHVNMDITADSQAKLKDSVLGFLKSQKRCFPDAQLEKQGSAAGVSPEVLHELSSLFVTTAKNNYGTRTHTVIMIDSNGNLNFHEWTLEEPINILKPQWKQSEYNFTLEK